MKTLMKSRKKITVKSRKKKGFWFTRIVKSTIDLYDDLYFSMKVRNTSAYCRKLERIPDKIGIDFVGTYDGDLINFYYLVDRLPKDLNIGFKERLRSECRGDVRITFCNLMNHHIIQWDSQQMKSKLSTLREVSKDNESEEVDAYNIHAKTSNISRQSWIEESLVYLADADKQRNRSLLKCSMMVIVSGRRGEDFDESVKQIEMFSRHAGIGLLRVLYDIHDVLRVVSPFFRGYNKGVIERIPAQVLTDEVAARFSSYTQGTIGKSGVIFGMDINSIRPMLKKVKPTTETAENWLITAETGGGKSYIVKALILQLSALKYNGTIMDIEGFEYIPLANFLSHRSKVQILNMAEGSGKYFDPVEIHRRIGIPEIDKAARKMSIDFTIATLKVLLGRAYNEDIWLDTVINDGVTENYKDAGVTEDMATWDNSKGLTLFNVYDRITTLEGFRDSVGYNNAVKMAIAVLSKYFEKGGTRAEIFRERILVSDIIDSDLLVCSFGMAGKTPQSIDQTQLALMQMTAAQVSHQRSIFSKARGKFNYKLWEEFQRWGKFPDSDKTLGAALTGGRKLGDVNIVITNVVKELLDDDRFGLFGNVTSFLCGAIADEKVRREFCDRLSIPHMKRELDEIASAKRVIDEIDDGIEMMIDDDMLAPYAFGFLCGLDKSKYGVVKMMLPDDLRKSDLFRTGINLAG